MEEENPKQKIEDTFKVLLPSRFQEVVQYIKRSKVNPRNKKKILVQFKPKSLSKVINIIRPNLKNENGFRIIQGNEILIARMIH